MNTNTVAVTPVPQVTLKEAVIEAVNELKGKGSFSAHDVTVAVRAAANGGEIALPGLEATPNQSGIKYWIDHEDVKEVIKGLLNDATLANLGLTNVENNGTYLIYHFDNATTAATPVPVAPTTTPASVNSTNPTQSPLAQRIQSYFGKVVGVVTLKQLQSALKVNGVTCKDYFGILTGLGYTVNTGTQDAFSTYTVG